MQTRQCVVSDSLGARCGPMCTQRLEGSNRETLGQRLLKEPIWIGLIVILSVITLFGVIYILRRKCGSLFVCCEVPRLKDDNILNADGTITLNSFPLKALTRPSISVISLSSPVFSGGSNRKVYSCVYLYYCSTFLQVPSHQCLLAGLRGLQAWCLPRVLEVLGSIPGKGWDFSTWTWTSSNTP
ncbi:unnamed protein product [Candidula unifasciata]|uniref:Uncharacterized protein n=1 Tax=Candidula unifasciata TaxID=100452 RepID=A0A8S3Z4X6_9EUPU|nr:unnamed protein product [Candidula unifasciata]